ncbi:Arrestin domain-containing protein 3 [Trichoplax sp. H2]|nr:Arrestin domain-containing protein 3 [Trichoplax sp. H2]|eukprot:RDD41387.1 Arrestin domain-containing protein 3 [Trichoplax sp. H2]
MPQTILSYYIFLDDLQEIYHARDIVSGHVHLELKNPLTIQCIQVRIHGRAKTQIQYGPTNDLRYAYSKRNIIDSMITANTEDTETVENPGVLFPGKYNFTFAFQLPKIQLPSTFEGLYGNSIRYMIKSYLISHESMTRKVKFKKIFLYHETMPSRLSHLMAPSEMVETEKTLCCFCCKSGPLLLRAQIDRTACRIGQDIKIITSQVENGTNLTLSGIWAGFVQTINREAEGRYYRDKVVYCLSTSGEAIRPNGRAIWNDHVITVPDVSPTNTKVDILKVEYYLKIFVNIPSSKTLQLKFPIIISNTL